MFFKINFSKNRKNRGAPIVAPELRTIRDRCDKDFCLQITLKSVYFFMFWLFCDEKKKNFLFSCLCPMYIIFFSLILIMLVEKTPKKFKNRQNAENQQKIYIRSKIRDFDFFRFFFFVFENWRYLWSELRISKKLSEYIKNTSHFKSLSHIYMR